MTSNLTWYLYSTGHSGVLQHIMSTNPNAGLFRELTYLRLGGCKYFLQLDLGYLMILCAKK